MRAGIIAAGEGSRLKSDGIACPKPLVPIDGVPLIERLLRTFVRSGITSVVCIVNENSLEIKKFVEDRQFGIPVQFVVKTTPSSMHSLFELSPYLMDGPFLLSTVDSVFSEDEFVTFLQCARDRARVSDGVLAVTDFIDDENPLFVQLEKESDCISSFSKTETAHLVTGGLYVFSPRIFDEKETVLTLRINRLRNFLSHLTHRGYRLEVYRFSKIIDVDRLHDITVAENFLRAH